MSTSRSSASPSPDRPWFPRFPSGTGRRHARSPCFVLRPALFLYSSSQRLFSRRVMRAATPLIRVLQSPLVPSQRVLRGEILFFTRRRSSFRFPLSTHESCPPPIPRIVPSARSASESPPNRSLLPLPDQNARVCRFANRSSIRFALRQPTSAFPHARGSSRRFRRGSILSPPSGFPPSDSPSAPGSPAG